MWLAALLINYHTIMPFAADFVPDPVIILPDGHVVRRSAFSHNSKPFLVAPHAPTRLPVEACDWRRNLL